MRTTRASEGERHRHTQATHCSTSSVDEAHASTVPGAAAPAAAPALSVVVVAAAAAIVVVVVVVAARPGRFCPGRAAHAAFALCTNSRSAQPPLLRRTTASHTGMLVSTTSLGLS